MTIELKRPAVLYDGGPMDGWAAYEDEAHARRRSCEAQDIEFPYEATGEMRVHPGAGGVLESAVWRYTGNDATAGRYAKWEAAIGAELGTAGRAGKQLAELARAAEVQQYIAEEILDKMIEAGTAQRSPAKPYYYRRSSS